MMRLFPCLLLLATSLVQAQPGPGPGPRGAQRQPPGFPQLLRLRTERIQAGMGLPEDKARQLAEQWQRRDIGLIQSSHELGRINRQMENIIQGPGSDSDKDQRLRPLLDRFFALRHDQVQVRSQFESEIRSTLTPSQQARFIILAESFDKDVREVMREHRRGNGRGN